MATPAKVNKGGCCGLVISVAISLILFWVLSKSTKPICSIDEFDVFALMGKTSNATNLSNIIHYDLKLKNKNFNKGIYYDGLSLTFYHKPNSNSFLVGNATLKPFYQGHRKSTHRVGNITSAGVKLANVAPPVVFRVELVMTVRYKNMLWRSKQQHFLVGTDLKVNEQGSLIKGKYNKGFILHSKAIKYNNGHFKLVGMLGILIFIHSW